MVNPETSRDFARHCKVGRQTGPSAVLGVPPWSANASLGAGVAFRVDKKMDLSISVRYTHGLIDTFDNVDAKNRTWSFMAGLTF
ncbi:MAG: hypothetical protein ACREND_05935 [Gemmatimonadaceae bacterium]